MPQQQHQKQQQQQDDSVIEAVDGLQQSIDKLSVRWERKCRKRLQLQSDEDLPELERRKLHKIQKTARRILQHITFCFTQLKLQLKALRCGLNAYQSILLKNLENTVPSLRNAFQWLLILHDGYILTVSGECRHMYDQQVAKSTTFPSQLNKDRDDQLYSESLVYSGTSWDEWNDRRCGLRSRLINVVKLLVPEKERNTLYDDLTEPGQPAALVEITVVAPIEDCMREIQQTFTKLTKTFLPTAIQRVTKASTVQLQWRDKMEVLHVASKSLNLKLERYGHQFQVNHGALAFSSLDEWNDHMTTEEHQPKRKRVILDDEDSSDEDQVKVPANKKNPPAEKNDVAKKAPLPKLDAGLVVTVQAKHSPQHQTSSSINEIKLQLGVNIDQLAANLEHFQSEQAEATLEAERIDSAPVDNDNDDDDQAVVQIQTVSRRVKRAQRALQRALRNDENRHSENNDIAIWNAREVLREECMRLGDLLIWVGDEKSVRRGIAYFEQARTLVTDQQELNARLHPDDDFYHDNLLLLKSQASVNTGIGCIQLGRVIIARMESQEYLERALRELDAALEYCQHQETRSLALRWKGTALWVLFRRLDAIRSFEQAAKCGVDAYDAWTTLGDLALASLERATVQSIQDKPQFYQTILDTVTHALTNAAAVATDNDDNMSPQELRENLKDIQTWWQKRSQTASQPIDYAKPDLPINAVELQDTSKPVRRFVVSEARRRKKQKHRGVGYSNIGNSDYASRPQPHTVPRKYRKWREDVQYDSQRREWVPKLAYPSLPPTMPPEFVALLAQQRRSTN